MKRQIDALPAGTRLGKYELVRLLGAGGMGAVYEAVHVDLKKRVAVKTLHPEVALRNVARQRFLREGEAASRIRHPHVVDVTDVDVQDGTPYLVMELLDGLDLKQHIVSRGPMSVLEAVETLIPVVGAVATGHDEGVIHRDLKPHNIFLARTRTGEIVPKVLDFGVSKLLDAKVGGISLTGTAAVMGTVAYMSPEQSRGAKFVDGRTDQYALALILYECLTGKRPHRGDNALAVLRNIGDGHVDAPSVHVAGVPEDLEKVILKGLEVQPDDRYPNLYQFGRALLPFASERVRALWGTTFDREPSQASVVFASEDAAPEGDAPAASPDAAAASPDPPAAAPESPGASPDAAAAGVAPVKAEPLGGVRSTPQVARLTPGTMPLGRPSAGLGGARAPGAPLERVSGPHAKGPGDGAESTFGQSAAELSVPAVAPGTKSRGPSRLLYGVGGALLAVGVIVAAVRFAGNEAAPARTSGAAIAAKADPAATDKAAGSAAPTARSASPQAAAAGTYHVEVAVEPASATLLVDDQRAGSGKLARDFPRDGRTHSLVVRAPGHEERRIEFGELALPDAKIVLKRATGKPAAMAGEAPSSKKRAPAGRAPATGKPAAAESKARPAASAEAKPEAKPATPKVGANGAVILKD